MPENTVKVDRTTFFGNPYKPGSNYLIRCTENYRAIRSKVRDLEHATELFRSEIEGRYWGRLSFGRTDIMALRGKNLACWCRLCPAHADGRELGVECSECAPCHADVLLEVVNRPIEGG